MAKKPSKRDKKPKAKRATIRIPSFAEPDHTKDKGVLVRANITDDLPLIRGEKKLCLVLRDTKTGEIADVIEEEVPIDALIELTKKLITIKKGRNR